MLSFLSIEIFFCQEHVKGKLKEFFFFSWKICVVEIEIGCLEKLPMSYKL